MTTHNLKEIKTLFPLVTMDLAADLAVKMYDREIKRKTAVVNNTLFPIYKRNLVFPASRTTEMLNKVQNFLDDAQANSVDIAYTIRRYLKEDVHFFKNIKGKEVPLSSKNILNAYKLVKLGIKPWRVRKMLYI